MRHWMQIVREDADSDIAAFKAAEDIMGALIRHLLHGDPDEHYGFKAMRFSDGEMLLTLRGHTIGLTGADAALWFRFGLMRGYAPSGHIARFKNSGETAITLYCLDDLFDTEAAAKKIIYVRPVHLALMHELTHYEESKSDATFLDTASHPDEADDGAAYYNNPKEMNAYYVNLAEPLLRLLRMAHDPDYRPGSLVRMAAATGIHTDFKQTLEGLLRHAGQTAMGPGLKKFYSKLTDDNRRLLLARLAALHDKVRPLLLDANQS